MLLLQLILLRQYYLDREMEKQLVREYIADEPRLSVIKADKLLQQARAVARNARSHAVHQIKTVLMASFKHTNDGIRVQVTHATIGLPCHAHTCITVFDGSLAREQFEDADNILEHYSYRDAVPDKPYSAPLFHSIVARAFSTADRKVMAFDLGMADYICDALPRGVRLRDTNADYIAFVATATTTVGKTIKTPDGRSQLKVILRRPPRCVSLRASCMLRGATQPFFAEAWLSTDTHYT